MSILDSAKYQFGRFLWPTLFMALGIYLLKMALVPEPHELNNGTILEVKQPSGFLYGALFFILGSGVWFLYLFGIIKTYVGYGIMAVMLGISSYLLYEDYMTIERDVLYNSRLAMIETDIQARLMDIKAAQSAFKEFYKYYTNDMDSLIYFVKNGKKMSVPNIGKLPERRITPEERDYIYKDDRPIDKLMTEQEANVLAHMPNPPADLIGFSRDTVYLPVLDAIFYDKKFQTNRRKLEASLDFHPDSLRYVPHTKSMVFMDTASVQKGEIRVPTILIKMVHPMDSTKVYTIGDLKENHLRDNWSR